MKKVSSSLVSGACNCFNGRSDFDLKISGGRTFSTRLVICKDSVPVAGVSMSVTDGVCCFGVEVFSSGHASLSGRQISSALSDLQQFVKTDSQSAVF